MNAFNPDIENTKAEAVYRLVQTRHAAAMRHGPLRRIGYGGGQPGVSFLIISHDDYRLLHRHMSRIGTFEGQFFDKPFMGAKIIRTTDIEDGALCFI